MCNFAMCGTFYGKQSIANLPKKLRKLARKRATKVIKDMKLNLEGFDGSIHNWYHITHSSEPRGLKIYCYIAVAWKVNTLNCISMFSQSIFDESYYLLDITSIQE